MCCVLSAHLIALKAPVQRELGPLNSTPKAICQQFPELGCLISTGKSCRSTKKYSCFTELCDGARDLQFSKTLCPSHTSLGTSPGHPRPPQ